MVLSVMSRSNSVVGHVWPKARSGVELKENVVNNNGHIFDWILIKLHENACFDWF